MILLDTSLWIEFLQGRPGAMLTGDEWTRIVTCGPIIQEVIQGVRAASIDVIIALLAMRRLSDPLPSRLFMQAADIYRSGRRKGLTIRSATDCLVAAIAIENRVPVWHRDRDFTAIAKFTSLAAIER